MKRADIARHLGWRKAVAPDERPEAAEGHDYYLRIHDPGPLDYAWIDRELNDSEFVSTCLWLNGSMVGGRMVEQRCPQILLPVLHADVPADPRELALAGAASVPGRVTLVIRDHP